jgi:type I restriction enzyme S subunit
MSKKIEQILKPDEVAHISQFTQDDKFNVGTSYPVIKDDDILNIPVPILSKDIHLSIKEKVQHSQRLRATAKELLECAKTAVEMAIEKAETSAIAWLEGKISELTAEVTKHE